MASRSIGPTADGSAQLGWRCNLLDFEAAGYPVTALYLVSSQRTSASVYDSQSVDLLARLKSSHRLSSGFST